MQLAPKLRPIAVALILTGFAVCGTLLRKRHFAGIYPQTKNVGRVLADSKLEVAFVVRNSMTRPIAVRSMRTSCSCTVLSALPAMLKPGEERQIQLKIQVGAISGRRTWSAAIDYDPGGPVAYTVNGIVESAVPTDVWFPEYKRGKRGAAQFRISATADNPVPSVESSGFDAEYFEVNSHKDPERTSDILFQIAEKPGIPYGGFNKELRLQIGGRRPSNVIIALHGKVTPLLSARPTTINFGKVGNGSVVTRTVTLSTSYGQQLVFLGAAPDRPVDLAASISAIKVANGDTIIPITLSSTFALFRDRPERRFPEVL
jgi:hypothetical protein